MPPETCPAGPASALGGCDLRESGGELWGLQRLSDPQAQAGQRLFQRGGGQGKPLFPHLLPPHLPDKQKAIAKQLKRDPTGSEADQSGGKLSKSQLGFPVKFSPRLYEPPSASAPELRTAKRPRRPSCDALWFPTFRASSSPQPPSCKAAGKRASLQRREYQVLGKPQRSCNTNKD